MSPPVIRERGRPKGAELTVIGLSKRRHRDDLQKLRLRPPSERQKGTICRSVNVLGLYIFIMTIKLIIH